MAAPNANRRPATGMLTNAGRRLVCIFVSLYGRLAARTGTGLRQIEPAKQPNQRSMLFVASPVSSRVIYFAKWFD
jgi:hypothetical protein